MLRLVHGKAEGGRPRAAVKDRSPASRGGWLDYSHMRLGKPSEVFDDLCKVLGELNFESFNIKTGISSQPARLMGKLVHEHPWREMKLLWSTDSRDQAAQMADLLHAWDAKLYLEHPEDASKQSSAPKQPIYAFAVVR